ncbi:toll-like receptor 2 type-2 [Schistocerca americana]|uniref:toll-like receptor 2 type-2 n=1 Tax=Schistocerca americana TaxID=7009 RepID=UPI001F4F606A|nr:toll-like receptor 2 type-2 [Schistocerca americana]
MLCYDRASLLSVRAPWPPSEELVRTYVEISRRVMLPGDGRKLASSAYRCVAAAVLLLLLGAAGATPEVDGTAHAALIDGGSSCPSEYLEDADIECPEMTSEGQLRCYLLYRALDYKPFASYGFAVLVNMTLSEIPDTSFAESSISGERDVCWSLSAIEVIKVENNSAVDWSRQRPHLDSFGVYLLYPVKEFRASATYPLTTSAVATTVNATCWYQQRSTGCIESAHVSQKILLPDYKEAHSDGPYTKKYWDNFREIHLKKLKAENITLHVEVQKGLFLDTPHYLQPLITNTTFKRLVLINTNLTNFAMSEQQKMEELKLVGSELSTDEAEKIIFSTQNLLSLSLENNSLTAIPQGVKRIQNLVTLDLSHNAINFSYYTTVLSSMSNLKWLNLAANPIGDLSAFIGHLSSEVQLHFLNVSDCSLFELEPTDNKSPLRHQKELQFLDLSYNGLYTLPSDIFVEMSHLETVQLSHNNLNKHLRLHLPYGIRVLDLSYNNFDSPEGIVETGSAEFVVLKGNDIYPWNNSNIFLLNNNPNSVWLSRLDISDCKINVVTEEMQKSFEYLQELDLGGNPFDCSDCSVPDFRGWLLSINETKYHPNLLNHGKHDDLTCVHPENLAKRLIVSVDDFSHCEPNYIILIGVPLLTVIALGAFSIFVLHFYRYEITYILHLVKIRKLRLANAAMTRNFQYDAFVSYSGKDRNWVIKKLVPQLENGPEKYMLCLHERDFILGSVISRNIASFMQQSKNTIIILTTNFVNSQWCQWELEMANHKVFAEDREFLIFIELERLERQKLPRHLRYLMDTRTYLEWPVPEDMSSETEINLWKRLRKSLGPSIAQIKAGHNLHHDAESIS